MSGVLCAFMTHLDGVVAMACRFQRNIIGPLVLTLLAAGALSACKRNPKPQTPPQPKVAVIRVVAIPVSVSDEDSGMGESRDPLASLDRTSSTRRRAR